MITIQAVLLLFTVVASAAQGIRLTGKMISSASAEQAAKYDIVRFPDETEEPPRFVFPEPSTTENLSTEKSGNTNEIPVSMFLNKNITSVDDFISNFVINQGDAYSAAENSEADDVSPDTGIMMRANSGGYQFSSPAGSGATMATLAYCEPQLTVVEIEKSSDPTVMYIPSCTRIERCGGCCSHYLLTCVPTKVEQKLLKVLKAKYVDGASGFQHQGTKTVTLEKHLGCECQCRMKEEDCNPLQEYRKGECRCVCTNNDEALQCNGENRFWDPATCTCSCRNVRDCSTGAFFNSATCKCEPLRSNAVSRMPNYRDIGLYEIITEDVGKEMKKKGFLGTRYPQFRSLLPKTTEYQTETSSES